MSEHLERATRFYIHLGGEDAPRPAVMRALREVSVESSLHLPDVATLRLLDQDGSLTDDDALLPGTSLTLHVAIGDAESLLFDGEIVELETEFTFGSPTVIVRAFDRLHRLSHGRKARSFVDVTDADIAKKLAEEAGLDAEAQEPGFVHPYLLQANESDLTFLARRAAAVGFLLRVRGKRLELFPPPPPEEGIPLEWKLGLAEFRPRLSGLGQFKRVSVRGWDPRARQEIVEETEAVELAPRIGEGRTGGALVQDAFGREAVRVVTDEAVSDARYAKVLARAVANRHGGEFIEAEGVASNGLGLLAGVWVRIRGVGARFEGDYFLTDVVHHYTVEGGYEVRFSVSGFRPGGLLPLLQPTFAAPRLSGVRIAIVTDNADPEGLGRVKVTFPWLTTEHASDWVRVVAPGAGKDRGMQWLPEVDDEVLVSFDFGDIQHPYVLGGLWNGRDALADAGAVADGKVERRVLRSREGHVIVLDDRPSEGGIFIIDKNGNRLALRSKDNALELEVSGAMTLKAGEGCELTVAGDLKLKADGAIELSAGGDLSMSAGGGITLEAKGGAAVVKGQGATLDASGGAAKVSGSSITLN